MKIFSSLIAVVLWLCASSANSQTLIQTITDPKGDGVNNLAGYNFDIVSVDVILNPDNSIRFVIDSYGELSGIKTYKALNGSIEYGDLKLQTNDNEFGINFIQNDSKLDSGIYQAPDWLSLGKQNYGLDKLTYTNLNSTTTEFLSNVDVVEIKNGGRNNTHRTVITVPSGVLTSGYYTMSLAFECVNDLITGGFNLDLKVPEFEKTKVTPKITWEITNLAANEESIPSLDSSTGGVGLGDEMYIFGGLALLGLVIALLIGSDSNAQSLEAASKDAQSPTKPNNPNKKETPEPTFPAISFLLLAWFMKLRTVSE